ncbi:lipoyl(octanoyl) transferase LipB [Sodalis sp. CWE]|uniref:lipoyl(octanoyl) transferase LipB n=1 Tax=Sodalis sp. CWE TaxID=2803816 RepID=UPI001C7D8559|nr:lipoyl(octanoyl) transferase LipB [Sodalis sp. CWE]
MKSETKKVIIRQLGLRPYAEVLSMMRCFTKTRNKDSYDEIWLVQHPQVFTQGRSGRTEHLLNIGSIPVVQSDRGGQITFHGPGQQVMYTLLNLDRYKLNIRSLVSLLEETVISTLSRFSIESVSYIEKPGVYVGTDKICSLGLSIYRGCSFHGLALNIAMDLSPFLLINPCGDANIRMTQMKELIPNIEIDDVAPILLKECLRRLDASLA